MNNTNRVITQDKILTPHPILCVQCHTLHTLKIDMKDYFLWRNGMLIQRAFPYLTDPERELFQTGLCGKCFSKLFPEPHD